MILRKYGTRLQSVTPNFDPHAMNEIGFQKTDDHVVATDEFAQAYESAQVHELSASAEGDVQGETEAQALAQLRQQLDELHAKLADGEVLLVESELGKDYPKMREKVTGVIVAGENKLRFHRFVDPPLRIGVYRPRKS